MKKRYKSIQSILILTFILFGMLPVIVLHITVRSTLEDRLINNRKIDIRQRLNIITTDLASKGNLSESLTPEMENRIDWYSEAYAGRVLLVDSSCKILLDTYQADTGKVCISDAVFSALSGNNFESYEKDNGFITFVMPIVVPSEEVTHTPLGCMVLSVTTDWIRDSLFSIDLGFALLEVILSILVVATSIYLSYLIVRPISGVQLELRKIAEGNLDVELTNIRSYSEINAIMASSSRVIRRYKELEQSQEEFVSNVSHELKTPMTSIRVLSDSLIGQTNVDEEIYQEFLSDISIEVDREARIIDDLLSMARLGKASDAMKIQTISMNEFMMEILKTVKPLALDRNIELIFESFRLVNADVDEMKMKQAVTNLIENAVKYNNDGGYVKVSLDADHEYFYLKVEDNGVGIPEDAIPLIFDRFYRVDKARSRDTGGTGLGLSITKAIVLLHFGNIKADSVPGEGTTFTVRIPLKHVNKGA